MPRPGLQRKRTAAALSQAGRARSANTHHPAGQPHTPPADQMYATDVRQHHCLMPPGQGHNNQLASESEETNNPIYKLRIDTLQPMLVSAN